MPQSSADHAAGSPLPGTRSAVLSTRLENYRFSLGDHEVPYFFGYSCRTALGELLTEHFAERGAVLMLVDGGVRRHAQHLLESLDQNVKVVPVTIDPDEQRKSLSLVGSLLERAVAEKIGRDAVVVAMGGGVVGNIAGMVAALLYRGLPLVHLPTTPVAAFDAVLSAKQAVNLTQGKNLCGTFLAPSLIACDLAWLSTVPTHMMTTGIVEMAKNVLAVRPADAERLAGVVPLIDTDSEFALRTFLDIGVKAKVPFIEADPKEKEAALIFEYGHTVGHAIEFASRGLISHGEAVGWGMLAAASVAKRFCGLSRTDERRHHELLAGLGLSSSRLSAVDRRAVTELLSKDNKRGYLRTDGETVAMVLLDALGSPVTADGRPLIGVPRALVESAIDELYPD